VSARSKVTRRRDGDPVRVYRDGRVYWYPSGKPGQGDRLMKRTGSLENGEKFAAELRDQLRRGPVRTGPKSGKTLAEMVQEMIDSMREEKQPDGTIASYKSDWNTHMADEIGAVRCRDAALWHYKAVFQRLARAGASEAVVNNVARTLGAIRKYGFEGGFFIDENTFGAAQQRQDLVADYRRRARIARAEEDKLIGLDVCPTVGDVADYAASVEVEYPGYGARLVWLGFATGLRICELLALKADSINLETMTVAVDWQLDRYRAWPAVRPPKGGKRRKARLWPAYADVADSLIKDAVRREGPEHGWLFPRHRSETKWADQAGHLATAAKQKCDWSWTFHWTRHAYASWNLAPKDEGGYGVHPARVQKWLGHARLKTTLDTYVHGPREETAPISEDDRRPPGKKAA
jgi:integrase